MARQLSRAEAWERAHDVFTQVNFNSFDFNTIKESLLDYTKLYFPEDYNDYIESSEFIAILELFAYVGELLAYRIDLNAHENFITSAQRKESILRLAKLISYKSTRNIPARGLVKITSIQTTETIIDSQGKNISNIRVAWNDINNINWKEQFLLIMNKVLEQNFGTVAPNERIQLDDVLFELYSLNNTPLSSTGASVIKYNTAVNGATYPMELVRVAFKDSNIIEKRPERNAKITILYGSDGLGDNSDTTGFFFLTKQGELRVREANFDGITPNQTLDVDINNINETDVWINNVDADTRVVIEQNPYDQILPHLSFGEARYGEWSELDVANAQNIIFNTNKNRNKYEIESLDGDKVRIVFGDGEFAEIPSGAFDVWYRTSANLDLVIPKSAIIDQTATFMYLDSNGATQTITFTFSLINSLQNASASEDIEHIRRVAPSVYYTQDRMVNGRDYNVFMLQDPSILKMRSINRTFAGDSKYIAWHDPKEYYEDVKIFGNDLALYWNEQDPLVGALQIVSEPISANAILTNYIEPLLCGTDFFSIIGLELEKINQSPAIIRCKFNGEAHPYSFDVNSNEISAIVSALNDATTTTPIVDLYYSVEYDEWTVSEHPLDGGSPSANSIWMVRIEAQFSGSVLSGWNVHSRTRRMISHSESTKFWNTNGTNRVINFNTLNSVADSIVILQANPTALGTALLDRNYNFGVLGQELTEQNLPGAGLPDEHKLSILPEDVNDDGVPDNLSQPLIFDAEYTLAASDFTGQILTLPNNRTVVNTTPQLLDEELEFYDTNNNRITFSSGLLSIPGSPAAIITDIIEVDSSVLLGSPISARLVFKSQVYFNRISIVDSWVPQVTTDEIRTLWALDVSTTESQKLYKRCSGRYPINFAWMHVTPRLHLVDPAATNIIDMFIITRGYYNSLQRYLENRTSVAPIEPSPRELRTTYSSLLENRMISDTVILHTGKFKILFGSRAVPQLRATFTVVRSTATNLTDNEVKVRIVSVVRSFFNIDSWQFGEPFYFTELAASIHANLGPEIDSVVIVPTYSQNQFGDLFQVQTREDELFIPDISTSDIQIVQSYTSEILRQ